MKIHRVSSGIFAVLLAVLFIGCGGGDDSVSTQAPSIDSESLVYFDNTATGVSISIAVNPRGSSTTVSFLVSENESHTPDIDIDTDSIGNGDNNVTAIGTVDGLDDGTEYHLRVSAVSLFGVRNENFTFTFVASP